MSLAIRLGFPSFVHLFEVVRMFTQSMAAHYHTISRSATGEVDEEESLSTNYCSLNDWYAREAVIW